MIDRVLPIPSHVLHIIISEPCLLVPTVFRFPGPIGNEPTSRPDPIAHRPVGDARAGLRHLPHPLMPHDTACGGKSVFIHMQVAATDSTIPHPYQDLIRARLRIGDFFDDKMLWTSHDRGLHCGASMVACPRPGKQCDCTDATSSKVGLRRQRVTCVPSTAAPASCKLASFPEP